MVGFGEAMIKSMNLPTLHFLLTIHVHVHVHVNVHVHLYATVICLRVYVHNDVLVFGSCMH